MKIAVLPGDGISQEIVPHAVEVLRALPGLGDKFEFEEAVIGGAALDLVGNALPDETLALARQADAILLGAVGTPRYEALARRGRPGTGLLRLRKELGLYANLRPARIYPVLIDASPIKADIVSSVDVLVIRELTGDLYFGEPRGRVNNEPGQRECINTMRYTEAEIVRIARAGFEAARGRRHKLCSVDKANVFETMAMWREIVNEVATEYPDVELRHLFVDAAAMALIRDPGQFDVMVTTNLFGDILSDVTAALTGSIGLMPSASLGGGSKGLYEPIHGSAPDIAGKNIANPLGMILSAAMMLRHSFDLPEAAARIEAAVEQVLNAGLRTADIAKPGESTVGTKQMGEAVVAAVRG
ncbi:MAG TPA: 3-isopropylmalate dehydrogenase [Devosia sp.]|nr:3-isopropylmalate dehydrogenase [Devosia sp.]